MGQPETKDVQPGSANKGAQAVSEITIPKRDPMEIRIEIARRPNPFFELLRRAQQLRS